MKSSIWLLLFLTSLRGFGQSIERSWESGDLTWNDFNGDPIISSSNSSELNYQLGYSTSRKKFGDTTVILFQTKNYINPNISWVKEFAKTDQLLRYNQVLFNILELHRRELQATLHRIANSYLAEEKFRIHYEACNYEVRRFQNETQLGANLSSLELWEMRIDKELKLNPYELVPEITDRNFGYGLNIGIGSGLLTGTIADHFTPTFNFVFGFDFAFKNTILYLNGTLAGDKVKSDYTEDGILWPKDLKTNVAIIDLSIGQTLLDNSNHKLTPFAGLGILEFTASNSEGEEFEDHRIVNYGLIYGLNYDFKIKKSLRLIPPPFRGNYREKIEHNIRIRLYATSGKFENVKGSSINLTVGYAVFGRFIKIN